MTPINLADLERWAAAKDAFPTLAGAAQAILEAPAIQWCKTHDSVATSEVCQARINMAYRVGGNPFDKITCRMVSARVVEVSE